MRDRLYGGASNTAFLQIKAGLFCPSRSYKPLIKVLSSLKINIAPFVVLGWEVISLWDIPYWMPFHESDEIMWWGRVLWNWHSLRARTKQCAITAWIPILRIRQKMELFRFNALYVALKFGYANTANTILWKNCVTPSMEKHELNSTRLPGENGRAETAPL